MIRPIEVADLPAALALIHELAGYELQPDSVEACPDDLEAAFFGPHPQAFAHVAVEGRAVVGLAVWSVSFSTWTGRHGIHLVDLVVSAQARRGGHGQALMRELARLCVERGYRRLDWDVLDALAQDAVPGHPGPHGFYRLQGGAPRAGWTGWRIDGDALVRLAAR